MSIASDLDKKVTLGDPDGPDTFVPELGVIVPTFVDPRNDLIPDAKASSGFIRLNYHVPFKMRGEYKPQDLPDAWLVANAARVVVDDQGYVMCSGTNKGNKSNCRCRAVNRSGFCRSHGGALHPADKKMSSMTIVKATDRVEQLDRTQKFMQGFLKPEDLSDEEVQGQFVFNDHGMKISTASLGMRFQAILNKELHQRLNRFLQSKTTSMLNVMVDIAESPLVEPADRIKAAVWVAERTMGKTPEILVHTRTDAPYEQIFETVEAGSREDYRNKAIESTRILDAEVVEDEAEDRVDEREDGVDDCGLSETEGDSGSTGNDNDNGGVSGRGLDGDGHSDRYDSRPPIHDPHAYAAAVLAQKAEAKALRARIAFEKKRRYAKRLGVGLNNAAGFGISYVAMPGGYTASLIVPKRPDAKLAGQHGASEAT